MSKKILFFFMLLMIGIRAMAAPTIVSTTHTDASCPGNGSITVVATGGVGLTYVISSGPAGYSTLPNSTGIFNSLTAGNYVITVTDGTGSVSTSTIVVGNTYLAFSISAATTSNVCTSYTPGGTITATKTGGSGPFQWGIQLASAGTTFTGTWSTPSASATYSQAVTGFGIYRVFVLDACGEIRTRDVNVTRTLVPLQFWYNHLFLDRPCAETPTSIGMPAGTTATQTATVRWAFNNSVGPVNAADGSYDGTRFDVYLPAVPGSIASSGTCSSTLGTLLYSYTLTATGSTAFVTHSDGSLLRFVIPREDVIFVITTPCGDVRQYCYNFDASVLIPNFNVDLLSYDCTPGSTDAYRVTMNNIVYFANPYNATLTTSTGKSRTYRVLGNTNTLISTTGGATFTMTWAPNRLWSGLSAADFPVSVTITDTCGVTLTKTVSLPVGTLPISGGTYSTSSSDSWCTSEKGANTVQLYGIDWGSFLGIANPSTTATITGGPVGSNPTVFPISFSGGSVSTRPTIYVSNIYPGYTYTITFTNACSTSATYSFTTLSTMPVINYNLVATTTPICGTATGNINASANTVGILGVSNYQLYNVLTPSTLYASNTTGNFTSVPAGTYNLRWSVDNANATCAGTATMSDNLNITVYDISTGQDIISKVVYYCDGDGNGSVSPILTGNASITVSGAGPFTYEIIRAADLASGAWITSATGVASNSYSWAIPLSGDPLTTPYVLRCTDNCGNRVTTNVSLQPLSPASITTSVNPCVGAVNYKVGINSFGLGFNYQWYKLPNTTTVIGTDSILTFSGSYSASNDGTYRCVYVNSGCVTRYVDVTLNSSSCGLALVNSLGNRVWRDDNQDGLQTPGEPGVAGVQVSLYSVGADGLVGTSDDNIVGSTITDAYGNYLFTNLEPSNSLNSSRYFVKVTPPANYSFSTQTNTVDYLNGAETSTDINGSDVNSAGISYAFRINEGETNLNLDAGLVFNATTLSSIGDRVWYDTDGDGVQDSGEEGIAGVTVTLLRETSSGSGVFVPYMSTTTNGSGNYLFNNLPNNTNYRVSVTPLPNTKLTTSSGTTTGAATTNSDVDPATRISSTINIPLAGANYTGIDAGLMADPKSSLGDRVWNDVNNNGIQDAGEQGIPNVVLTLSKETAVGSGIFNVLTTTITDANGKYIFTDLDPAKYKVSATLPSGYAVSAVDAGTDDYADNDFSIAATPITGEYDLLANQDYAGIDYGVHNTTSGLGSIGDKVWSDTDGDGIQDAGEIGLAGITVRLLDGSGNPVNNPATGLPYVLITDASGNYKFVDLPAGNYRVSFSNLPVNTVFSPLGAGTSATDNNADASGVTNTIALSAGTNLTDIDAGVMPFAPTGLGSIGDKVFVDANNNGIQDLGEQGLAGVTVTLYQADGTTVIRTTTTNPMGGYLFDGLSAGSYVIGFSGFPSSYALQAGKNDLGGNDQLDSDPNPTTGKTPIITIASGEDNSSVDAGVYNTTATNSIGNFVWLDQNNDGLQTAGEPGIPGVVVSLINSSGFVVSSVVTDALGSYSFDNLPNGNYTIRTTLPTGFGFTTPNAGTVADVNINSKFAADGTSSTIALTGGSIVTNIDAGLLSTKAILGDRVWNDIDGDGLQDAGEAGIAGVTVTLFAADGSTVLSSTITDANGNYLFTNLDPGDFVLGYTTIPSGLIFTVKGAAGSSASTGSDVNVASGKTDIITLGSGDINLNIDAGLTPILTGGISGVVWFDGASGDFNRGTSEPLIPGVTVTLRNSAGNVVGTTLTNGTGAYQFTNLPAGTGYTVTFSGYTGSLITQTTGTATGSDPDPGTGVTPPITVVGGAITSNIDAGYDIFAPLPLTLTQFVAKTQNCSVVLQWETGLEYQVKHINVKRSIDGVEYMTIATISPNGSNSKYHFIDKEPVNGRNLYRLEFVDLNDVKSVSPVVVSNLNCKQIAGITVYPNPTTGKITIFGLNGQKSIINVLNLQGHLIKSVMTSKSSELIDIESNPSGSYLMQIIEQDEVKLNAILEKL